MPWRGSARCSTHASEVGICGPRLELDDGSFDHAAKRSFPTPIGALAHFTGIGRSERAGGRLAQYRATELAEDEAGPVDAVNGAFMLMRRAALDEVGLFDEGYWMYMEDLDLCYRFKQGGWVVWYEPSATVVHVKAGTSGEYRSWRLNRAFHYGMYRFYRVHYAPRAGLAERGLVYSGIAGKLMVSAARSAVIALRVATSGQAMTEDLEVGLDLGLPRELVVGRGTTIFVYGSAWHPEGELRALELMVGDRCMPVEEFGMPRRDVYVEAERARLHTLDPEADWMPPYRLQAASVPEPTPHSPSYRSGFWGYAELPGVEVPETVELGLRGTIDGGGMAQRSLGAVTLLPSLDTEPLAVPSAADGAAEPLVAICMATFNPRLDELTAQVRSIQAQAHRNWVCVISDDDSREEVQAEIARLVADDPRFVFRRGNGRVGFFRNFERALAAVPPEADYVALADQDDRWYPEKLSRLTESIAGHQLVFSDMRIVDEAGSLMSDTFWDHRPNNTTEVDRLLLMNTVTGAASLFRRELLDLILPFPMRLGPRAFHDQWIGAVALSTGSLGYVDEPLYDYVQHERSVLGHPSAYGQRRRRASRARPATALRTARNLLRRLLPASGRRPLAASALRAGDGSAQVAAGEANVATEVDRRPGAAREAGCRAPDPQRQLRRGA